MARLPNASELSAVEGVLAVGTVYYLALFTSDPGTSGASGEVSGGSYARQAITFVSSGGNELVSGGTDAGQIFTNMPSGLTGGTPYFGIFTTGGTYLCGGATSGLSSAISAGATISFASGAIAAQVS